jgi:tRNA A-37 threonylcarbamoyl transferase component Bud32
VDSEEIARRLLRTLDEQARSPRGEPELTRYEIRDRIGEGATAVVYRAWDRELRRTVAVKVLKERAAKNEIVRQRFRRESQAAAGLSHPNLVPVYDVGEENGRLFIVMELVEGRTLSEWLRGPADPSRVGLIEKVARGVAAAHAKGIVHRDLKPGNILVTAGGEPKVADFGLAHLLGPEEELTRTGSTLGTPLYMSPEQVRGRGREISPRTDVYALGAILYELLAGRPPHGGETPMDLYEKILNDDPAPLPGAPPDLDTIARKALAKEPAGRYGTAGEFAEDLRRAAAGEPILARPESWLGRWRRALSRRRRLLLGVSTAAVFAAALLGVRSRLAAPVAIVDEASGEVTLASESGGTPVGRGAELRPGQLLRTGASGAASLRTRDGARLSLGTGTMLQSLDGGFFVALGSVSGVSGSGPLSMRTPHGQAEAGTGTIKLEVFPTWTWIEATRGAAQVRRAGDGRTENLREGFYVALGPGRDLAPRPAAEGLIGYWPFEESSGNVARDASGHGNDGLFLHAPSGREGKNGRGAEFDGTNYVEVPGVEGARFPSSGTLAMWLKGDFRSQEFTDLVDTYDPARRHLFVRGLRSPAGLQVVFQQDSYRFERVLPVAEGEWTHLAVTWDAPGRKGALYLNGSLTYAGPLGDPSWAPDAQTFRLGGAGTGKWTFRGSLDEVRLYGTPLNPEAIRDLCTR